MEKIKFNFTDEEIKNMIYKVINENLYWVYNINRVEYDSLDGTIVSLKARSSTDQKKIKIVFLHDKLEVEGLSQDKILRLYASYFSEVFKKVPKYGEIFEESKQLAEEFVKDDHKRIKDAMVRTLYEGGFLSTNLVKSRIQTYRYTGVKQEDLRIGNHVTFVDLRPNSFNIPDRKIQIGHVYVTDLNPVADGEYGGIRPCVVIGRSADKATYYCVPLSKQFDQGIEIGIVQGIKSYAVTSKMKIVVPQRFYEHIDELDD